MEFPDKIGTPGFPSPEEFARTDFARTGFAGLPISYSEYLFGLHSIPTLIQGPIKGWIESTVYMSASLAPQLNELVMLYTASGIHAVLRRVNAVTVAIVVMCLSLTLLGWISLWRHPLYWCVTFLCFGGTWYAAYLYCVRLLEPFRHTGHVYPLLLLSMLWGDYWLYQRFGLFVKPRTPYAENRPITLPQHD